MVHCVIFFQITGHYDFMIKIVLKAILVLDSSLLVVLTPMISLHNLDNKTSQSFIK